MFLLTLVVIGMDVWNYFALAGVHQSIGLPKGDALSYYLIAVGVPQGKNLTGRIKVYNQSRRDNPVRVYVQTYDQFRSPGSIFRGEFVQLMNAPDADYSEIDHSMSWGFSITTPVAGDYYFVLNYASASACTTELEYSVLSLEPEKSFEQQQFALKIGVALLSGVVAWLTRK